MAATRSTTLEIGLKSALYFLFSLSILLVLSGLTILIVDFFDGRQRPGTIRDQAACE